MDFLSVYWKADEEALRNVLLRLFGSEAELPCKLATESSSINALTEESEFEFDDH